MHGLSPDEEIDYWRERAKRAEAEAGRMRAVYEAARRWMRSRDHVPINLLSGREIDLMHALAMTDGEQPTALAEGGERE